MSSHWKKAAATASADQGVFSNVKHITAWFGHCLLYYFLYISSYSRCSHYLEEEEYDEEYLLRLLGLLLLLDPELLLLLPLE